MSLPMHVYTQALMSVHLLLIKDKSEQLRNSLSALLFLLLIVSVETTDPQ